MPIKPRLLIQELNRMNDIGNDRTGFVRLDKNERTIPFDDAFINGMIDYLKGHDLTAYPDQAPLYKKLSRFLDVKGDQLLLTAGSDAAIKIIYETYVSPGDEVVFLNPTYAMIGVYAKLFGAKATMVGYDKELNLDFKHLIKSIKGSTKAVFIANPNQPTGTTLTKEQIESLLTHCQETETLLVFDEAYIHFADYESLIARVNDYDNLVVTQTFSKAIGLASIRLGFIVSQNCNISSLYKTKTLSDINIAALKFGEYAIDNYAEIENYVKSVKDAKKYVVQELSALGLQTIPGEANFMHIRFSDPKHIQKIAEDMKEDGFLIRTTGQGLPAVLENAIRITIGPLEQMKEFTQKFKSIVNKYYP